MFATLAINQFLEKTASNAPAPGGGSIAALSAAIAASLSEKVAKLSVDKKGFEENQGEMKALLDEASWYRKKLVEDIDRDADAFNQVVAAFRLSKQTEKDRLNRTNAIQKALKAAARVPLEVAEDAMKIMALAEKAVTEGNENAVTDAVTAVMMARTAVLAAAYNVHINCASITDRHFVKKTSQRARQLEAAAEAKEKDIRQNLRLPDHV